MKQIVDQVLEVFEGFRMAPTPLDQYEQVGKARLADKMAPYIAAGVPIEFVMLGFPFKSMNTRDKVIGVLPDLGEQITLDNFVTFNNRVKEVYAPGVRVNIISDGLIFNGLEEIADSTVMDYYEANKDMSKTACINWYNARDFYSSRLSNNEIRSKIITQFGITPEKLEQEILTNPDVNFLYRGMIKFTGLDIAIKDFPSQHQLQKAAKKMAREMMMLNEAYSNLIATEFKDYVRLSMHPSVNDGAKYSFQLIPGPKEKVWTSPWHCAILVDKAGDYVTVHRKDAIASGYKLVNMGGRPFYFIEN